VRALVAAVLLLALAGCTPTPGHPRATVTVFAAASLTEVFQQLGDEFSPEHPDVDIVFNFGGSSTLATQIVEGAPADVFAAASPATMTTVEDAGLTTSTPTPFASNELEIAVQPGNPSGVTGIVDFADPELAIVVCAVEVPCGAAAQNAFEAAGVTPSIDSYEADVKAVLARVQLGDADAGLVYRTDVLAADDVDGIELAEDTTTSYPIATTSDSSNASAFLAFVLSARGQSVLQAAGFGAP
jgi:molybdate transport system substrate-binding protein